MKFIIATKNKNKIKEFNRILLPLGIDVVSENEINVALPEVEEDGSTFIENAFLKAKSACEVSNLPAIADDSGLCVEALDGAPGIYSARFAGEKCDNDKNNQKLLELLKDVEDNKRDAYFVSAICVVFPNGDTLKCIGKCDGKIGYELKGCNGFGYDPLFLVGERSFAELSGEEKDKISHRGKALRQLYKDLKEYINA